MCSHNSYPSSYEDSLVVTNYLTLFYADSYVIYYVVVSYFFFFFYYEFSANFASFYLPRVAL